LGSLFPCGSITGAPKVRAMEVIRELEEEPPGIYTGAVGMNEPSGNLLFNVAIRSLWLDQSAGDGKKKGEMGIGSGVVFDSDGAAEYRECLLKAEFLTRPYQDFQLIETLRWEKGEYWLLSQHLERLVATAQHFLYPFDEKAVHHALENAAEGFGEECYRVRLTLSHEGEAAVTSSAITAPGPDTLGRFVLSEKASNSNDPFFYHKTTQRALYDGEHARLSAKTGCDEVFFINERGELTEGSRSNIFIERGGELLTPPIAAGILAGTFRRHLIEDSKRPTREKTLWPEDLKTADAVYMGNSVRGLVRVVPVA